MRISGMLRIISEIESIADCCFNVAKTTQRKLQNNVKFPDTINEEVDRMFAIVDKAMENMLAILKEMETPDESKIIKAYNIEREINSYRNQLRDTNIANINDKQYDFQDGIFFMDLIGEAEKMGDLVINVVEGVKHQFREETI